MSEPPIAKAGMLIRRQVSDGVRGVRRSLDHQPVSGSPMAAGRWNRDGRVRWEWEMYGAGSDVVVKAVEPDRRILIDWDEAVRPS